MVGKLLNQWSADTGISQKEVAEKLGFSRQRVNNYYRDISDPPFDFYKKFRQEFHVDLKGLLNKESKVTAAGVASYNPIPVFDLDVKPSSFLDFFNRNELIVYYIDAPMYNDCFAAIKINGVDMAPAFNASDLVAIKRIMNFETVPYGHYFYIVTDEQRLLRYIKPGPDQKTFTLRAENAGFDDMTVKKTDIKYLFQVKGKMSKF